MKVKVERFKGQTPTKIILSAETDEEVHQLEGLRQHQTLSVTEITPRTKIRGTSVTIISER